MSEIAVGIATAISLAMAAMLGVFQLKRINGPSRLDEGEPSTIVLTVAGAGLFFWGMVSLIADQTVLRRPPNTPLSAKEQVLLNGAMYLAGLTAMILTTLRIRKNGLHRLGAGLSQVAPGLIAGCLSIAIVLPLIFWIQSGSEYLWTLLGQQHNSAHALLILLGNTQSIWLRSAIVVTAVVVAPLTEEMFFRGQIQTFFRYAFRSPWLAVLLTSIAFAYVHEWWTRPSIFFLGFCLGYLYERTGNLWACVVLHAMFNLASIMIYVHATGG